MCNNNKVVGKHCAQPNRESYTPYSRQSSNGVAPQQYLNHTKSGKPKLKVWEKILIAISIIVVLAGSSAFAYMYHINSEMKLADKEDYSRLCKILEEPASSQDPFYALVLGSDSRTKDIKGTRSDVIILCHVIPETNTVDMVSIPRDTAVNLPGRGVCKINAAMAWDGVSGAVECVSQFAGVPIPHYAVVRFDNVVDIVDSLDGIFVNIPQSFKTGPQGYEFTKGPMKLNGNQALAFARERHHVQGGDFARAQAQRHVVKAVANRVMEASPTQLPGLIESLAKGVTTDMSAAEIVSLAAQFQDGGITFYSATCPSYCKGINGGSYVCTILDKWQTMMRKVDAGVDPSEGAASLPSGYVPDPKVGVPTNSASPTYSSTVDQASQVLPEY